jgi:hypothetical protein
MSDNNCLAMFTHTETCESCYHFGFQQVAHLQEERAALVQDNEKLNERINMAENFEDPR